MSSALQVRVVSQLLERNTSVVDLNLRGNAMGADGVAALQAMCRTNSAPSFRRGETQVR